MRKILILLLFSIAATGQQISVQNNELKYRTSGGVATAANKDSVTAQIAAVSFDTTSLSNRIDFKVDKITGKGLSTNDYSNAAAATLAANAANIVLLQADRNALFDSIGVHRTIIDSLAANSGGGGDVMLAGDNAFTGVNTFSGNTILGSTVDSGERLQVTGSTKVSGNISIINVPDFQEAIKINNSLRMFTYGNRMVYQSLPIASNGIFFGGTSLYNFTMQILSTPSHQGVYIGDGSNNLTKAHPSANLELYSKTQGFLPPRMTEAQKNAIATPAEGLMVYQTDGTKGWYGYNGAAWVILN